MPAAQQASPIWPHAPPWHPPPVQTPSAIAPVPVQAPAAATHWLVAPLQQPPLSQRL
jgi:hypothetical protein